MRPFGMRPAARGGRLLVPVRERYRFALIALSLFAAAMALSCSGDDTSSPPPTIISDPFHAAPAVVRVELLLTSSGKATTRYWGTGTFVAPGIVLTSARLVDPAGGWDTIG